MSVLIKTMEMPKNCGECQFCHTEYFKQWCCPTGREDIYCDAIPEWCPLEKPKTGWIPCSERLPKEYAQYLVCLGSGECYVYWLEDSDWARSMTEKDGVLAWMPLPKPYRKDER